jgi:hypothetical protein
VTWVIRDELSFNYDKGTKYSLQVIHKNGLFTEMNYPRKQIVHRNDLSTEIGLSTEKTYPRKQII